MRVWLDPSKRDSTTPVPQWVGTCNPPPQYMDLALYNLHSLDIKKIETYYKTHKQNHTLEEIMKIFLNYDPQSHIIIRRHCEKDRVLYASSKEMGHVIAYAKGTPLHGMTLEAETANKRWDMAIIEFENSSIEIYPKGKNNRSLTMYDENFTLTRACDILEVYELEQILTGELEALKEPTSQNGSELESLR
jgi:hypothetical protein